MRTFDRIINQTYHQNWIGEDKENYFLLYDQIKIKNTNDYGVVQKKIKSIDIRISKQMSSSYSTTKALSSVNHYKLPYTILQRGNEFFADPVNDTFISYYRLPTIKTVLETLLASHSNKPELFLEDKQSLIIPVANIRNYAYSPYLHINRRHWMLYILSCTVQNGATIIDENYIDFETHNLKTNKYHLFSYYSLFRSYPQSKYIAESTSHYDFRSSKNEIMRNKADCLPSSSQQLLNYINKIYFSTNKDIFANAPRSYIKSYSAWDYTIMCIRSALVSIGNWRNEEPLSFLLFMFWTSFVTLYLTFVYFPPLFVAVISSIFALLSLPYSHSPYRFLRMATTSLFSVYYSLLAYLVPLPVQVNEYEDWSILHERLNDRSCAADMLLRDIFVNDDVWRNTTKSDGVLKKRILAALKDYFRSPNHLLNTLPIYANNLHICPISKNPFTNPVILKLNMKTYDRSHIYEVFNFFLLDMQKVIKDNSGDDTTDKPNTHKLLQEHYKSHLSEDKSYFQPIILYLIDFVRNNEDNVPDIISRFYKYCSTNTNQLFEEDVDTKRILQLQSNCKIPIYSSICSDNTIKSDVAKFIDEPSDYPDHFEEISKTDYNKNTLRSLIGASCLNATPTVD